MQLAVAAHDRQYERRADNYAVKLGYGEEMVDALYRLEELSLEGKGGILEKILASHPRVTSRIEELEIRLGIQENEIICPHCDKRHAYRVYSCRNCGYFIFRKSPK
jgi:predicted Zn-dependent protease